MHFSCSLECYKSHQQRELCHPLKTTTTDPDIANVPYQLESGKILQMFTTDDTVTVENLQKLEGNVKLKDLLCNPHLREFLRQIDSSTDAWKAMKIAMLEPLFLEFADACLDTVEPPSPTDRMFETTREAF